VRNNLSICPIEAEPGQVDRSGFGLSEEARAGANSGCRTSQVVEDGLRAARHWIETLTDIALARPPADVPLTRWAQLIDDIGRLIDSKFAQKAAALGWTVLDLFGCDREKPFARIDRQGLCWLIAGNRIVEFSETGAIIETWTGARQTWRRKQSESGRVLPWELEG
jgi:hypothetical protein